MCVCVYVYIFHNFYGIKLRDKCKCHRLYILLVIRERISP